MKQDELLCLYEKCRLCPRDCKAERSGYYVGITKPKAKKMFKMFKKREKTALPVKIPKHVAFICDGNRRWAEARGLPPLLGHRAGIANFETLVDWFIARGVTTVTFFIFSTENWNRSEEEVNFLMDLFYTELEKNLKHAIEKNLRYRVIGTRDRLPKKLAKMCDELEEKSAETTLITLFFLLSMDILTGRTSKTFFPTFFPAFFPAFLPGKA